MASSAFRRFRAASSRFALTKSGRNLGLSRFGSPGKGATLSADPVFDADRGLPRLRFGGSDVSAETVGLDPRPRWGFAGSGVFGTSAGPGGFGM